MLFFSTYGGVAFLIVLAIWRLYRAALPKPIAGIPYNPAAISLLGDFPQFQKWHASRKEVYTWIVTQTEKLNSPVIQLFMRPLGKPWVIVTDFREAQDIMARRTQDFGRAKIFGDLFVSLLPNWHTHMETGDEWRAHRRLIADVVTPDFLRDVAAPQIYATTLRTIQLWKQKIRLTKGRPFPAFNDIHHGALDIIWAAAFGNEIGATKSQIAALSLLEESIPLPINVDSAVELPTAPTPAAFNSIITLTHSVEIALSSPFPRQHHWFVLNFLPRFRKAMQHKNDLIKERLEQARRKFSQPSNQGDIKCAAELFVQREIAMARKEGRKPQYDTPVIRDELFGFLVAGHETTAITVCWGLKFLTAHQGVQHKLRSILRTTFRRAAMAGDNPTPQEIAQANIPYLDGAIEEMHRLGGTVSSNVRSTLRDTYILGHFVPKGTDVFLINQGADYVTHPFLVDENKRSKTSAALKERYGSWDVSKMGQFMPERWLVENEKGEVQFNPYAGPNHPFGAGPRGCFGRKFAQMELKIIMCLVLWNFVLQPTPPELSSFLGADVNTHIPQQFYLRLAEAR